MSKEHWMTFFGVILGLVVLCWIMLFKSDTRHDPHEWDWYDDI